MFASAVQPAHVDALRGTVIQGMFSLLAISFPASRTFPPPDATIASQKECFAIEDIRCKSISQQS